jgi:hypothetical protein
MSGLSGRLKSFCGGLYSTVACQLAVHNEAKELIKFGGLS